MSSRHPLQPPRCSSIESSQLNCTIPRGAANAGDAGPWMVGPTRYPELNGRPMRDAGVQVQLSTSVTDVVSVLHEHVQVQTEVCEKFDRSSSPVPSPPASNVGDEGAHLNSTVDCSMKHAMKLWTERHHFQRPQSTRICILHEDLFGFRVRALLQLMQRYTPAIPLQTTLTTRTPVTILQGHSRSRCGATA
jgi:hypothetical protein